MVLYAYHFTLSCHSWMWTTTCPYFGSHTFSLPPRVYGKSCDCVCVYDKDSKWVLALHMRLVVISILNR